MSIQRNMDQCSDCKAWLPAEDPRPAGVEREPCSACGSTKRIKYPEAHITVEVSVRADAQLIISWHEVDRLLAKAEHAAALLVAAVNVEFILWESLRRFTPSTGLVNASQKVKSVWGQVTANKSDKVTLSSLITVVEHFTQDDKLLFAPPCQPLVQEIEDVRNQIAHERGYEPPRLFRRLCYVSPATMTGAS